MHHQVSHACAKGREEGECARRRDAWPRSLAPRLGWNRARTERPRPACVAALIHSATAGKHARAALHSAQPRRTSRGSFPRPRRTARIRWLGEAEAVAQVAFVCAAAAVGAPLRGSHPLDAAWARRPGRCRGKAFRRLRRIGSLRRLGFSLHSPGQDAPATPDPSRPRVSPCPRRFFAPRECACHGYLPRIGSLANRTTSRPLPPPLRVAPRSASTLRMSLWRPCWRARANWPR